MGGGFTSGEERGGSGCGGPGNQRLEIDFPFCAFNGGNDVWFDIGNKKEGIEGLQRLFQIGPPNCLHVGDQMARTGNDFMARFCSSVCWIVNPAETKKILRHIMRNQGAADEDGKDLTTRDGGARDGSTAAGGEKVEKHSHGSPRSASPASPRILPTYVSVPGAETPLQPASASASSAISKESQDVCFDQNDGNDLGLPGIGKKKSVFLKSFFGKKKF